MKVSIQDLTSLGLLGCALVITGLLLFGGHRQEPPAGGPPVPVDDWQGLVAGGRRIGPGNATNVIVEFGDFECPACAAFEHGVLMPLRSAHPHSLAVVWHHWPLSYHRFAYPAARASECAAAQGRFAAYHDVLYETHDSLGLIPFTALAERAQVPDDTQFESCIARSDPIIRVDQDAALAQKIGGSGTPTIVINGFRFPGVPTRSQVDSALAATGSGGQQ